MIIHVHCTQHCTNLKLQTTLRSLHLLPQCQKFPVHKESPSQNKQILYMFLCQCPKSARVALLVASLKNLHLGVARKHRVQQQTRNGGENTQSRGAQFIQGLPLQHTVYPNTNLTWKKSDRNGKIHVNASHLCIYLYLYNIYIYRYLYGIYGISFTK